MSTTFLDTNTSRSKAPAHCVLGETERRVRGHRPRGRAFGRLHRRCSDQGSPWRGASRLISTGRRSERPRITKEAEMGILIATTQATLDGVIDPVAEWVQPDGDHGTYSFERQA